jgi:hypothetical protein
MEEDLTNVNLTVEQARDLLAQLSAALDGRQRLLDIVMPNGKDEPLYRPLVISRIG